MEKTRTIPVSARIETLGAGDFDGDRALDVLALEQFYRLAVVYSAATATTVTKTISFGVAVGDGFAIGDLDGNGTDDLVMDDWDVVTFFARRDRTFALDREYWIPGHTLSSGQTSPFALADLDHDGDPDVAAAGPPGVTFLDNKGDGTLKSAVFGRYVFNGRTAALANPDGTIALDDDSISANWGAAVDLNHDGRLDSVMYKISSPAFFIRLGDGAATFLQRMLPEGQGPARSDFASAMVTAPSVSCAFCSV